MAVSLILGLFFGTVWGYLSRSLHQTAIESDSIMNSTGKKQHGLETEQ